MAKAKFEKLNNSTDKQTTHADLQKKKGPGAPKGKRKKERSVRQI